MMDNDWKIYTGKKEPHNDIIKKLPDPPPWRDFTKAKIDTHGSTFRVDDDGDGKEVEIINAALYLRRPLLVTGPPGSGKSSLARAVAYELNLGKVLHWPINSRSTLKDALYLYDAVARLRDLAYEQRRYETTKDEKVFLSEDIESYITLGPLGTALFPKNDKPRVLLIDEIDKSDIDLPNDLLHIFEEGEFAIAELVRWASGRKKKKSFRIMPYDGEKDADKIEIQNGKAKCTKFPLIFMTSNGDRSFPPAFLRRCLHLQIKEPSEEHLRNIIDAHLKYYNADHMEKILDTYNKKSGIVATDQLLNAVFLLAGNREIEDDAERKRIEETILDELDRI